MNSLRIALAQINPTVGDFEGNTRKIIQYIRQAEKLKADLVAFPELSLPGYPPEDLLLRPGFIDANLRSLEQILRSTARMAVTSVIGFIDREDDIFNAAAVIHGGKVWGRYRKMHLPNYGVFDELRYFRPGRGCEVFELQGVRIGISICEDIWYPDGPTLDQVAIGGAEILLNISSSPYHTGKLQQRQRMLATRASDNAVIIAYNNLVGGQDELVFDGGSMIFDQEGEILAVGRQFAEDLVVADLDIDAVFRLRLKDPRMRQKRRGTSTSPSDCIRKTVIGAPEARSSRPLIVKAALSASCRESEIYSALMVGTHDYVQKNGFKSVVLGLSGGIDSALTACVAADALNPEKVIGVSMPSRFTSGMSRNDARLLADKLGIRFLEIPIGKPMQAYRETLAEVFKGLPEDVAEENLQARIRGNILMALSNKFGYLVLTTGNKSEMSVGYCTLYGDMVGGFAVLKDVPKTLVQGLAAFRNRQGPGSPIPANTLTRPPTAELRPNQLDTDSLPEYAVLDGILHAYVEEDMGLNEIVALGYSRAMVSRVIRLVDLNEYKRRQGPPGIKITPRAFGRDRRMPLTNRYRG